MMIKKFMLFLLIVSVVSFASVYIENGMVVFSFEYEAEQVFLAGNFNDWSPESLPMVNENGLWKISMELEPGEYQYKFVVNGTNWMEDPDAPSYVDDGFGGKNGAFKLVLENEQLIIKPLETSTQEDTVNYEYNENRENTIFVDEEGYIVIRYYNPDAEYVMIAGDFNDWDPESLEMYEVGDGWWEAVLELEPGVYQYKFVVNGEEWVSDPNAFAYVDDGFGGKNSVLEVYKENEELKVGAPGKKESKVEIKEEESKEIPLGVSIVDGKVYFKVQKEQATKAYLAGSFNNWDPQALEMKNVDGYWVVSLELNPGKYEYKYVFIINGNQTWEEDPNAPGYIPDGFGGKNGIFEVVEEDGKLVIKKPEENTPEGSMGLKGEYGFTLTYKYDSDSILTGVGFTNSLNLILNPTDEIELSLEYSGANIQYAKINFSIGKFNFLAHYNLPIELPITGIQSGICLTYDSRYYIDLGVVNNSLSWLIGVQFERFSLNYGNKYFEEESAILAGYNFNALNLTFSLFGGYYIDSTDFAVILDALSEKWNLNFSYIRSLISASLNINSWEFSGNYSLLNNNYDLTFGIPLFEKYSIFGGYSHTSLIDKSFIGVNYIEEDYNIGLKVRSETSNIYFDVFGSVNF